MLLGLMFVMLKTLSMSALNSNFALSPRIRMLGKPKALEMVISTSLYLGPGKELRPIPGGGMKLVVDCPGLSVMALA